MLLSDWILFIKYEVHTLWYSISFSWKTVMLYVENWLEKEIDHFSLYFICHEFLIIKSKLLKFYTRKYFVSTYHNWFVKIIIGYKKLLFVKGSLHKKNMVKLGKKSKQGGREVISSQPNSQPLNSFFKNYPECPETHYKHRTIFSFVGGRSDT